jgi:hypothetical protein
MQDNKYNVGDEVWFYENNRLFNAYIASWQLLSGNLEYEYNLILSEDIRCRKMESELFQERQSASDKMSGIVGKADPII